MRKIAALAMVLFLTAPLFAEQAKPLSASAKTEGAVRYQALSFIDLDEKTHDVDSIVAKGKNVILVYWQTWCRACKKEAPEINAAYKKYGDKLAFFGVVSGSGKFVREKKVLKTIKKWKLAYPQVRDRDSALSELMRVKGTPTLVILGEGGEVLYRGHRPPEAWDDYLGPGSKPDGKE